jgi:gliding motility-associatede transport system auxiliary component
MASGVTHPKPSFSPWRKWSIGLNVVLIILVVFSVVVMVNYLSRDYFTRFHWSSTSKHVLSPRTLTLLHSLTNKVKVIIYYDQNEPFFSTVVSLLNEYKFANSRISIENVDYVRDAGAAQRIKTEYNLSFPSATNLIIFDCEGRKKVLDGNALTRYIMEPVPNEKEREFRRKPTAFEGEEMFTKALFAVTTPTLLNAYFLQGHREHSVDDSDLGFAKFVNITRQNTIVPKPLSLLGTNSVPMDCNLLVIAGPRDALADFELEKIDQYLSQGGRLLALFNAGSINSETGGEITGLDKILAKWGVEIGTNIIHDAEHTSPNGHGQDIIVTDFSPKHPLVNPLIDSYVYMVQPRAVQRLKTMPQTADAPKVEELAFTGPNAKAGTSAPQRYSLIAAVEKGAIKGVITERGTTRIVVAGDSVFLTNAGLRNLTNRDFAEYALNWLLERTQLLGGVGPRSIVEYRVVMSQSQLQRVEWILLGAIPGGVLLLGGLVWLRRRR